jgi:hypothetical protein
MKILTLQPFLNSAAISPDSNEDNEISILITQLLIGEGHEIFVLPWENERLWDTTPFLVSEDSSYATALPTLYLPRITDVLGSIFQHFSSHKRAWRNPDEEVMTLWKNAVYNKKFFLKKAMKRVKPDLVHVFFNEPNIPKLYRKGSFTSPIILTHFSGHFYEEFTQYDFVIFSGKKQFETALNEFPVLEDKSALIDHTIHDESPQHLTESYLQVYDKLVPDKEQKEVIQ